MNAVVFDTLQMARRLEAAGMPTAQAQGVASALGESLTGELATQRDIADLRRDISELRTEQKADAAALRTEIAALRTELKGDIAALRAELKGHIAALRAELKGDIDTLRTEMKTDIAALRTEVKTDIASVRTELKGDIADLRHAILTSEQRITIRMGGMLAAAVVLIGALVKLL